MTSEDKAILSQLTSGNSDLNVILSQQGKIENIASTKLDAIFLIDLFNELKTQDRKNGLESVTKQFQSVFYWEKDETILKQIGIDKGND